MSTITIRDRDRLLGHGAELSRLSLRSAAAAAQVLVERLLLWQERASQRRQLLGLGDTGLKDFGACRADAAREGDKPFWRG